MAAVITTFYNKEQYNATETVSKKNLVAIVNKSKNGTVHSQL